MIAVRALVAAVEAAGGTREQLLAQAGLSAAELERADARISFDQYGSARRAALIVSADPALGLHMGERANVGAFDVLGYLAEHGSTLRDALHMIIRYARIIMDGQQQELLETGDSAIMCCTQLVGDAPETRLTAEFAMSSFWFLIQRFMRQPVEARRVYFAYPAPLHRAEYTRIFAGREQFDHSFTGIEIDRAWLDSAPPYRSPELCSLLRDRAEVMLARVEQDAPAAERVRRWLASQSLESRPTMDVVARGLGMSARSLRRRLHDEQARYDNLVEDARSLRAKRMLADPRLSVQETAYALGFVTPGAFSRAFKRWTGAAPSAFRPAR